MSGIWVASLLWIVTHLGVSSTGLRKVLVGLVGTQIYLLLYSLLAAASLSYLIWTYIDTPSFEYLWLPNPDLYWVAKLTMPIALILLVGGFMVKNPTNIGMKIDEPEQAGELARGVTRITRHPFQWAVVLWAGGHVIANGDWASVIFFSSFLLVSLLGSYLMDHKKAATMGPGWVKYAQATSNLPFAAIATGRNRLVLQELWLPTLVGLLVYALGFYFHAAYTGAVIV